MHTSSPLLKRTVWLGAALVAIVLLLILAPAAQAAPDTSGHSTGGYWYAVQRGDTWYRVSAKTGVSVQALQSANPKHIHPRKWLYVGHRLWIPGYSPHPPAPHPPPCGYHYTVAYGDSWTRVAAKTGVSVAALRAANPHAVRPPRYWLYAGETLWIPCQSHRPPPPPPPVCLYYYTVQCGDSWSRVSYRTGVPVHMLQRANPNHMHRNNWLYAGHTLCIPDP
jgi:LysM repeat protein